MTKIKLMYWKTSAKKVQLKAGPELLMLKATSSFFARMLVIASREEIDLEEVIGTYELHTQPGY